MAIEIKRAEAPKAKRSKAIDYIIIFAAVCVVAGAIYIFYKGFSEYGEMRKMKLKWIEMAELADTPDPDAPEGYIELAAGEGSVTGELGPELKNDTDDYLYKAVNLKALRSVNPDVSGYIYMPNTMVDYPILKESMPERYYYLNHDIRKNYDKYGSIFELCDEERGEPGIENAANIIFGHNMKSGAMFAGIVNYNYAGFSGNPMYIYRDEYRIEYVPFAACSLDAKDMLYDFDAYAVGSDNYKELLDRLKGLSSAKFDADFPDANTPMIALSTCSGSDGYTSARTVVFFKESRRAVTPEYYDNLNDVKQYGGDRNGILQEKLEETITPWMEEYKKAESEKAKNGGAEGFVIG